MQAMNSNVERSLSPSIGGRSKHELEIQPARQMQKRLRPSDPQHLDSELKVRLEERQKERGRIARELHDTLFQGFLGASLLLQAAVDQTPADSPTVSSLNRVLHLMHRGIDEGRAALREMRSTASVSPRLEETLYGLWDELTPGGVEFRILVEGQPKALNPAVQEQIYLIVREAVHNALQHSRATAVEAEVEYSARRLRVIMRDNGCGMDPQVVRAGRDLHWGLQGMRERAASVGAQLRIWSRRGAGTEVEISIPIQNAAHAFLQLASANIDTMPQPHWGNASPTPM
jgi:signal transduction histidine kinase